MSDAELFAGFVTYQQARSFSPSTIRRRRLSISRFARFVAPSSVTEATAVDIDEWLSKLASARTRHAYRSDLAVFYRWAVRRGFLASSPVEGTDSVRVPKVLPRPMSAADVAGAYIAANARLQLAILLGALAGLRVGEMVNLDAADIHLEAEPPVIHVRAGKGAKDRVVPIHPTLRPHLEQLPAGWLFPAQGRTHIQPESLGRRLKEHFERCGVDATAHQLRHHFGTEAARWARGDLMVVRGLMGHSSTDTTMGYIAFTPSEGADVVAKITAPGVEDELTRRRRQQRTG
jgi:integrase/recombinase XerC